MSFLAVSAARAAAPAETKPKYGPRATLLSQSHDHIQKRPAPDYWAMSPYYIGQENGRSCSVASVAMAVNAARSGRRLSADDELATEKGLLKRVKNEVWQGHMSGKGRMIVLDDLKPILEESLKAYGLDRFTVEVFHADDTSPATKKRLHEALVENEKSARDFILINFNQAVYTGDAEVGHVAPIAAYDAKARRALVFDPDREWYEPYWVSEETLLDGMATLDKGARRNRGWVWIRLGK